MSEHALKPSADAVLIGEAMTGGYGGADILHECTIAVEKGEIAVIVGPNGAGKSTAMKAVFGMLKLRKGAVRLKGEDITALTPQARVGKGMGFVPQTNNIFPSMTVEENLEMGAINSKRQSSRSTIFFPFCATNGGKQRASYRADSANRWPWGARS